MKKAEPQIILDQVGIIYNDYKIGLQALTDINLTIAPGEFISIVGPSGCGKSTILKIISDILDLETTVLKGKVTILGKTASEARQARNVGFVFQKPTLLQWRTVFQNIALPLEIIGISKSERFQKIENLLKLVHLEKYANFHPDQLSGGMQQKVSIARALAYDPPILLMDEPFAALDELGRRQLNDELIKIWQKTKKTIVFVTHSIEEAVYLSERVVILSKQPAQIKKIETISFPYPRKTIFNDLEFFKAITNIRKLLENEE
ncbi:MAG: ABC transporter ATP-binding protein [bacterium]